MNVAAGHTPFDATAFPRNEPRGISPQTPFLPKEQLREMLTRMIRIRLFDEQASRVRSRLIPGALHNSIGQEAEIVGACMALRDDDYITGNHRSHGHPIGKGARLAPLMAELLGKTRGVCRGKGGSMHLADFGVGSLGESGIVGSLMPIATGAGLSARLRKTEQVCLCFFGDGAANCGAFHESLNLAAIWKLPVIFLCENNGYGICSSQLRTTAVRDVATRADSYGIPGVVADGQDALCVYHNVSWAVTRARAGEGPTLIEAKTYRYCEHQELDFTWPRYRSEEEVMSWRKRDPIDILTRQLLRSECLTEREIEDTEARVKGEVEAALAFALASPVQSPSALFEDVFCEQKDSLV